MPPRRLVRQAVPNSQPRRNGLRDFAPAQDGGAPIHIRTYDPIADKFTYTRAGKIWLGGSRVDYVALIPVEIQTLRRSGAIASYMGYFPVANLPQTTDEIIFNEERSAAGRDRVKAKVFGTPEEYSGYWRVG